MSRNFRFVLFILLLAIAGSIAYWVYGGDGTSTGASEFKTAAIERGEISQEVTATGTLNPVMIVNVGTQVSGTVEKLYVDFNDKVTEGQVLAELEPSLFNAQLARSRAQLENAAAALKLTSLNRDRIRTLYKQEYVAKAELDRAEQEYVAAAAQASIAQASVKSDEANLGYSIIRSPVAGTVISRDIAIGQTVAASFQTPTLFKIAQDLRQMQIDTNVSEADVGYLTEGKPVTFTVDAYPDRKFSGVIKQVRLNPTNLQNVVTYNVIVAVDNPDMVLLPGMTAFVTILIADKKDVLLVPTGAFRFRPKDMKEPPQPTVDGARTIYILRDGWPTPVQVKAGVSDSRNTELTAGGVSEGDKVITGYAENKK